MHADALVLLSDVDALYDGAADPPGRRAGSPTSQAGDDLEGVDARPHRRGGVGTGGMVTKVEAARIATGAGHPGRAHRRRPRGRRAGRGGRRHLFLPTGQRRPIRLLWLAHLRRGGRLVLDDGAVRAVVERQASLLPAGITAVRGHFEAGDPVDLVGPDGAVVARGLVNYAAAELPALLGRTTQGPGPGAGCRRTSARSSTATTSCCYDETRRVRPGLG